MKSSRRKFSLEFKQEAVDLVQRSGKSSNQIARELGVNQTSLSRWMREAESRPGNENVFVTQEEVRRLRKEVERLKMERDILKKATVRSMGQCNAIQMNRIFGGDVDGSNGKTGVIGCSESGAVAPMERWAIAERYWLCAGEARWLGLRCHFVAWRNRAGGATTFAFGVDAGRA